MIPMISDAKTMTLDELKVVVLGLVGYRNIALRTFATATNLNAQQLTGYNEVQETYCVVPDYTTDIAAAWTLIDKAIENPDERVELALSDFMECSCPCPLWRMKTESVCEFICRAFYFAMTGTRIEIEGRP